VISRPRASVGAGGARDEEESDGVEEYAEVGTDRRPADTQHAVR
jgi:hypothetical protein